MVAVDPDLFHRDELEYEIRARGRNPKGGVHALRCNVSLVSKVSSSPRVYYQYGFIINSATLLVRHFVT